MAGLAAKPRGQKGGNPAKVISKDEQAAHNLTVDQQHYILQVRDIGISKSQMSDDKILTVLHDNGNDVAQLASTYYDGKRTPAPGVEGRYFRLHDNA